MKIPQEMLDTLKESVGKSQTEKLILQKRELELMERQTIALETIAKFFIYK